MPLSTQVVMAMTTNNAVKFNFNNIFNSNKLYSASIDDQ
jgi:hypothetical protein